jgi:hypothetical protein
MLAAIATDTNALHFPAAYVAEARCWLMDLPWENIEPDEIAQVPGAVCLRVVGRWWEGGLENFAAACQWAAPCAASFAPDIPQLGRS